MLIAGLITAAAILLFDDDGFLPFLARFLAVFLIPNLIFYGVLGKTAEFRFLAGKVPWLPHS
jgi:hypothetical protein